MCKVKGSPEETVKSLSGMGNWASIEGPETGDQDLAFTFMVLTVQWWRQLPKQIVPVQVVRCEIDFISKTKGRRG